MSRIPTQLSCFDCRCQKLVHRAPDPSIDTLVLLPIANHICPRRTIRRLYRSAVLPIITAVDLDDAAKRAVEAAKDAKASA